MPLRKDDGEPVWFRVVEGRALERYGTGSWLGCERTPDGGLAWRKTPVAISQGEWRRYRKEYTSAVRRGDLVGPVEAPAPVVEPVAKPKDEPRLDAARAQGAEPTKGRAR